MECKWGPCETTATAAGYCGAHYRQQRLGEELRPVRGSSLYHQAKLNAEGKKQCSKCSYWLELSAFYSRTDGSGKPLGRAHCNRCNILRRMSINARQYDDLLSEQGGGCAICGKTTAENKRGLPVDHDHNCCPRDGSCGKCIRGIVCDDCNAVLGRAHDSPEILRKAINYLG